MEMPTKGPDVRQSAEIPSQTHICLHVVSAASCHYVAALVFPFLNFEPPVSQSYLTATQHVLVFCFGHLVLCRTSTS